MNFIHPTVGAFACSVLFASSLHAAEIVGTVEEASVEAPFELTALGELDWAYWNTSANPAPSGDPTNRKTGGSMIGAISAVGGTGIRGAGSAATGTYDFTDGTSPASGSGITLTGLLNQSLGSANTGVELTMTLPTAGTYEILVWTPNYSNSVSATFELTATIGGETYLSPLVGGGNPPLTHIHTLTVTADSPDQVLTLSNVIRTVGTDGNGHARISAVAVSAGVPPTPDTFTLTISPATAPDTGYDLEWDSQAGKVYNLRTSTDLAGGITTWDMVASDIVATPPSNTFNVDPADPKRFYAVEELDAPPFFTADFETDGAGFTVETSAGTAWQWGAPDSNNGFGLLITGGNSGSANAWATALGDFGGTSDNGFYANPTTTFLRSPVIDLAGVTSAVLTFAEAADFSASDAAEVYVIDDVTNAPLDAAPIHISSTGAILTQDWIKANAGEPITLPAAAMNRPIRLEWRFSGSGDNFLGWYVDDVEVTGSAP